MALALSHSRDKNAKDLAQNYSQLNSPQMIVGKKLFASLNLKHGGERLRILDMGCGTGELTAFIADTLDHENCEIIGVDPILERINIAMNRHRRPNLTFAHADCSGGFPHAGEAYYDWYFSNFVFHWLRAEEKDVFIKTAFESLKPGGKIAITSVEEEQEIVHGIADLHLNDGNVWHPPLYSITKLDTAVLFQNTGFQIVSNETKPDIQTFENMDEFLRYACATYYIPEGKLRKDKIEEFKQKFANGDGTVTMSEPTVYELIAMRPQLSCSRQF